MFSETDYFSTIHTVTCKFGQKVFNKQQQTATRIKAGKQIRK